MSNEPARTGALRTGNWVGRRGGIILPMAILMSAFGLVVAVALAQIILQPQLTAENGVHRSAAFAAANAGLEQSKLIVGHSTIFTDANHPSFSFSGTLNNESYTCRVVWAGGMSVQVTSTGTSGNATCVLARNCLAAPDSAKLRVVNYISTDTTKFSYDITSIPQRSPLELGGSVELPNFDYWRQLAIAQGHYYTGDVRFQNATLSPGVYFSEGGITFSGGNSTGSSVTMVAMTYFYMQNNTVLSAPDRLDPVIISDGWVTLDSGHAFTSGTIWAAGAFLIKNGAIAEGRVEAQSFTQSNGTLTDSGDPSVYQFLKGFAYNPLAAGWLLTYSGWWETWQ